MKAQKLKAALIIFLLILTACSPILLYVYNFGTNLSLDHERWGEFGSLLSGIYSPLIALFTVIILIRQFQFQVKSNKLQDDLSYVANTRSDINRNLNQLEDTLNESYSASVNVKYTLIRRFMSATDEELNGEELFKIAMRFDMQFHKIQGKWSAIYSLMDGLEVTKRYPYKHNVSAAKYDLISTLSYGTCVALDNYLYCISKDRLRKGKYYFRGDE